MKIELKATVEVPDNMPRDEVVRLVQRLIDAGEEDAASTPRDWSDPDTKKIARMSHVTVTE